MRTTYVTCWRHLLRGSYEETAPVQCRPTGLKQVGISLTGASLGLHFSYRRAELSTRDRFYLVSVNILRIYTYFVDQQQTKRHVTDAVIDRETAR